MSRFIKDLKDINFTFEGKKISAKEGDTIAIALCANNILTNRKTINSNTSRGSFCHMGVCYECLVTVNKKTSVQACKCIIAEGMEITKNG